MNSFKAFISNLYILKAFSGVSVFVGTFLKPNCIGYKIMDDNHL